MLFLPLVACDTALPLLVLEGDIPQPHIVVTMKLSGTHVDFELDTGAAVTLLGEATFNRIFPDQQLKRSPIQLRTYTGEPMRTLGAFEVEVAYQEQGPKTLSLVVVEGRGPSLFGRDWLGAHQVSADGKRFTSAATP